MELRTAEILREIALLRLEVQRLGEMVTLDTEEAAAYLKCSPATIRAMVQRGEVVPFKAGTGFRFHKCDLDSNRHSAARVKASSIADGLRVKRASA